MKKLLGFAGIILSSTILFGQSAFASTWYSAGSTGVDVSYPNCSVKLPSVAYGIVGVNGGLVYSHNACAAAEAKNFSNLSLYINTGLNASSSSPYYTQALASCAGDIYCAAYNYGYDAAKDSLAYAGSQGLQSSKWWLDVETGNSWSSDTQQNKQSLQGAFDAIVASGAATVGVYSTTAQWQSIAGGWQNNWPSWGATTWTTASQAQKYCTGHQFTGGPSLLMQYKSRQSKVDQDVAC